jgi:hypothetical protein
LIVLIYPSFSCPINARGTVEISGVPQYKIYGTIAIHIPITIVTGDALRNGDRLFDSDDIRFGHGWRDSDGADTSR